MIHLYCGDGKGKTTCAFGLVLRAAGRGESVVVAQFLKTGDSGERVALVHVPGVTLLPLPEKMKFTFAMDDEEKREAAEIVSRLMDEVEQTLEEGTEFAMLDECCAAISTGLLQQERLNALLDRWGGGRELVLTGRDPSPSLLARADYLTEMKKLRHPFDTGVPARCGVEF